MVLVGVQVIAVPVLEVESLVAAIMANAEPAQLWSGVDRLEAALGAGART